MEPKVLLWTDFVCPFCYVADHEYEVASDELKIEVPLEIYSYELNPDLETDKDMTYAEYLKQAYDLSDEEVEKSIGESKDFAASVGVEINYDKLPVCNTHDAHRLKEYARLEDKSHEFYLHVQRAYFIDNQDISDHEVLKTLAKEVGLDTDRVNEVLESDRYSATVKDQHAAGVTKAINYVPHFVFPTGRVLEGELKKDDIKPILDHEFSYYGTVSTE